MEKPPFPVPRFLLWFTKFCCWGSLWNSGRYLRCGIPAMLVYLEYCLKSCLLVIKRTYFRMQKYWLLLFWPSKKKRISSHVKLITAYCFKSFKSFQRFEFQLELENWGLRTISNTPLFFLAKREVKLTQFFQGWGCKLARSTPMIFSSYFRSKPIFGAKMVYIYTAARQSASC